MEEAIDIGKITESICSKFQLFEFSSFDQFTSLDKVIFLVGNSKSGKSTTFLALQKIALEAKKIEGTPLPVVQSESDQHKDIIGHGNIAKTKLPNIAELNIKVGRKNNQSIKLCIVDCPGLLDSKGFLDDLTNRYFVMKVFKLVKDVRFLLFLTDANISQNNVASLTTALTGYLKYFKEQSVNIQKIIDSTSLVVTKTNLVNSENIKQFTQSSSKALQQGGSAKALQAKVLNQLVESGRVYYFQRPKTGDKVGAQLAVTILEKQSAQPFYTLNFDKDISFQLSQGDDKLNDNGQKFQQIYTEIFQKVKNVCVIIKSVYDQMVKNITLPQQKKTHNYVKAIKDFVGANDIYDASKKDIEGRKKKLSAFMEPNNPKPEERKDYAQLIALRNIVPESAANSKPNDHLEKLCEVYLANFLNYLYIPQNHPIQPLINFAYILKRKLYEMMILETINTRDIKRDYRDLRDSLMTTQGIVAKEKEFIQQYKLRPQCTVSYLEQLIKFLNDFKYLAEIEDYTTQQTQKNQQITNFNTQLNTKDQTIQSLTQRLPTQPNLQPQIDIANQQKTQLTTNITTANAELTQINTKLQQLKTQAQPFNMCRDQILIKAQYARGKIYDNEKQFGKAFKECQQARVRLELLYAKQNAGGYKKTMVQIYENLGRICEEQLLQYDLAIEYYKVIRYHKSIRRSFSKLRKLEPRFSDKKVENLKKESDFLAEIGKAEEAYDVLEQAYEEIEAGSPNEDQKRKQILVNLNKIKTEKSAKEQAYWKKVQAQECYAKPIQEKITQLKAAVPNN